ncbi:MAG TPA: peptide chain release factor N(5)-glutamine methyltransferase [Acidimicrobiales bacterium]|nr:peptide chain release factor N(5)-glutamine methyltransferase [Acidimicrobiales bacterium]
MTSGRSQPAWREVLRRATDELGSAHEARWVVERASGWEGAELVGHLDEAGSARAVTHVQAMIARRVSGEPLQYVLGRWQFRGLELFVDRRVLIPRPETEWVAEAAVAEVGRAERRDPVVVDLGTGSGAIGLSLAAEVPGARVWATDASPEALAVARANLAGLGSGAATRVRLVEGDWWEALPDELRGTVDLVVSNPPYVAADEQLPAEVADWEPGSALRAGPTGLEALEVVVGGAPTWLRRPGALVAEVAPHQAQAAATMAVDAGFDDVEVRPDLTGRPRALVARSRAGEP